MIIASTKSVIDLLEGIDIVILYGLYPYRTKILRKLPLLYMPAMNSPCYCYFKAIDEEYSYDIFVKQQAEMSCGTNTKRLRLFSGYHGRILYAAIDIMKPFVGVNTTLFSEALVFIV